MKGETFKDIRFIPIIIEAIENEIAMLGDCPLTDRLHHEIEVLRTRKRDLERALRAIDDPEIIDIIKWHYLKNFTWSATNMKLYGYPCDSYSRKRCERYFNSKELSDIVP